MRICFISLFLFLCLTIIANEPVKVKKQGYEIGGFGGFGLNYTEISSCESLGATIQGGVILNHWLAGGIQANTFFSINPLKDKLTDQDANMLGVYGGLFASPIVYSNSLVHFTVPIFVGYGGLYYELYDLTNSVSQIEDSDQFWVFEPGIELEINILRFLRLAVGGYYRCSSKIKLAYKNGSDPILPDNVLNGFSVGVKLRFGKF